jgi:hypothetical protein
MEKHKAAYNFHGSSTTYACRGVTPATSNMTYKPAPTGASIDPVKQSYKMYTLSGWKHIIKP